MVVTQKTVVRSLKIIKTIVEFSVYDCRNSKRIKVKAKTNIKFPFLS